MFSLTKHVCLVAFLITLNWSYSGKIFCIFEKEIFGPPPKFYFSSLKRRELLKFTYGQLSGALSRKWARKWKREWARKWRSKITMITVATRHPNQSKDHWKCVSFFENTNSDTHGVVVYQGQNQYQDLNKDLYC